MVVPVESFALHAQLDHLKQQSEDVKEEDEARLSPLSHKHVNMLGHYSFTLTEQVLNGQLRPLKQPSELDECPTVFMVS
ncbi:Tn3 family transposase [Xenorhabdus japonica]|uniref:Tn3 family transposase n=1 Tax=Xenorhabdus japonica TaxID=53341 RepID=UPI00158744A6